MSRFLFALALLVTLPLTLSGASVQAVEPTVESSVIVASRKCADDFKQKIAAVDTAPTTFDRTILGYINSYNDCVNSAKSAGHNQSNRNSSTSTSNSSNPFNRVSPPASSTTTTDDTTTTTTTDSTLQEIFIAKLNTFLKANLASAMVINSVRSEIIQSLGYVTRTLEFSTSCISTLPTADKDNLSKYTTNWSTNLRAAYKPKVEALKSIAELRALLKTIRGSEINSWARVYVGLCKISQGYTAITKLESLLPGLAERNQEANTSRNALLTEAKAKLEVAKTNILTAVNPEVATTEMNLITTAETNINDAYAKIREATQLVRSGSSYNNCVAGSINCLLQYSNPFKK